jgi:hypothetical protein
MKIKDDRGELHHAGSMVARSALAIRDFDKMRMVEKRIKQKSRALHLVFEIVCLVLLSLPFLAGALVLSYELGSGWTPERIGFVLLGGFGSLILLCGISRPHTMQRERNKLERKLDVYKFQFQHTCEVCLYDLEGLSPEDDGCTVCPECVAAWRLGTPDSLVHETDAEA